MSKALLLGSEEGRAPTFITRHGANALTRLIFALISEAGPKLPTYRRGEQVQRDWVTHLEIVIQ